MDEMEGSLNLGVAGDSAEREYQRRVAARKRRITDRFGFRLGRFVQALTDEPQSTTAWAKGAKGEREMARSLAGVGDVWVLNDRRVPGTRGNIDHLIVASAGVFVVDSKAHAGTVKVRDVGGLLRQDERLYVGRRDCTKLAEGMAWQVDAVRAAVRAFGLAPEPAIVPVICFVEADWPLFGAPSFYKGVRLESPKSLKKLLVSLSNLDAETVGALATRLAEAFPPK